MKTALYVACTARAYRLAMDDYERDPSLYERKREWYREEIGKCTIRGFTTGFFYGKPGEDAQIYEESTYHTEYVYLGSAGKPGPDGFFSLEQKNKFSVGEILEIMKPDGRNLPARVEAIADEEGNPQPSAPHARQKLRVKLSETPAEFDLLRRAGARK